MAVLVVLALYRIKADGFWYDEAISLTVARSSLERFIEVSIQGEANGSLYHLLLRAWRLLGESEARIRSLSVLCMAATIPLLYLLGRRHLGRPAGLIACVLFAVNPFVIEYAQEARSYALAVVLTAAAVLAWSFATETGRGRWWIAYAVLGALSLYAHFFSGFVLLGLGITWLLGFTPRTRASVIAQAATVVAAVPVALYVAQSGLSQVSWIPPFSDAGVAAVLGRVGHGLPALAALLYGAAIVGIVARGRDRPGPLAPIVAWWLTPVVAGIGLSLWRSLLEPRYYIVALAPLLLLAAAGFVRAGGLIAGAARRPGLAPVAVLVPVAIAIAVSLGPLGSWRSIVDGDWRAAAGWVARTAEPGDRVIYEVERGRYPMRLYLDRLGVGWPVDATIDAARATGGRTWLVLHKVSDFGYRTFMTTMPGYRVVASKVFRGLRVQLLDRP